MKYQVKPAVVDVANKATAIAVAVLFLKRNGMGCIGYGSMRGKRHTKIHLYLLSKAQLEDVQFLRFPHYFAAPGEEEFYLFALTPNPSVHMQPIKWLRIAPSLVGVSPVEGLSIAPQYGGCLIATMKKSHPKAKEGKVLYLPFPEDDIDIP